MKFSLSLQIIAARSMIAQGLIGDLYDMEIRMQVYMPWHLWSFLYGKPDAFEYVILEDSKAPHWQMLDIKGSWFPEAFIGTMSSLQRYMLGESDLLPTSVEDAFRTMAVVEAAYESSEKGGSSSQRGEMIKVSAHVINSNGNHEVRLSTNDNAHSITIRSKASGYGSSANGGELLFLALATCYCNDLYREAAKQNIVIHRVEVEVSGDFGDTPGSVAENIEYKAVVEAEASEQAILDLMQHTDRVAEIQNTLRRGTTVTLAETKAISVS